MLYLTKPTTSLGVQEKQKNSTKQIVAVSVFKCYLILMFKMFIVE